MLQPTTHTWRNAVPTGMGFDPSAYAFTQRTRGAHPLAGFSGLGDGPTTSQLESLAATGASTTVSLLTAFSVIGGPVGAAISAGIGVAMAVAQFFKGCGQACIVETQDANKLEPYLQQNLAAYLSSPIRTTSMQAAFLNNFDTLFNTLVQACGDPALGASGQRCISDRRAGACQWKASQSGWTKNADGTCTWTPAGPSGSGDMCWNWYVGYRDPIANDPCVVPDAVLQNLINGPAASSSSPGAGANPSSGSSPASASGSSSASAFPMPLVLGAAGLLLLLALGGD